MLTLKFNKNANEPKFKTIAKNSNDFPKEGYTVIYSNRCPYTEYHVNVSLRETANKRNLNINRIKLSTLEAAQKSPTPATIFSLYYNGVFVTTDISVCMDSKFDKIINKSLKT